MNKKKLTIINERIEILKNKFGVEFEYYEEDGKMRVLSNHPHDSYYDEEGIDIDAFLLYTENIEELRKIDETSVCCGRFRQTIIEEGDPFGKCYPSLLTQECKLSIVNNPFLIGIMAYKEGYDKEDPYSFYTAVELEYIDSTRLSEDDETALIKRYLYKVSTLLGYSLTIDAFHNWYIFFDKEDENICKYKNCVLSIESIPPFNKAMDYYLEALKASNRNIRFLSFYKVMEYFSPAVSKKAYYEEMNKRLDAMTVIGRSYEDLNEVFDLVNKYNSSLDDKEIPKTILMNCVDVESLLVFLPKWVCNKLGINKNLNKKKNNNERILEINCMLGSILYSTRNRIVHAKSNFKPNGNECPEEEIVQLNMFMDKLCQCLFVWNGRQTENYQLK